MKIRNLYICNFRNLEEARISPHPGLNVLQGTNGAGKTSVLEAIVVLSRGRSFRTAQAADLVGPNSKTFQIFAEASDSSGNPAKLGLERSGKHWRGRMNGQDLSQLSQLTRCLPLVLIEPDSHLLISGAPDVRRKHLDWGLFHVEHEFLNTWRSFSKALKQRNAALRNANEHVLDSLDAILADHGSRLAATRARFVEQITTLIQGTIENLSYNLSDIGIEYQKGWKGDSYLDSLRKNRPRDIERGQTSVGPHRADLLLTCGKASARAVLSRGEQKMLAVALLLTQAEMLASMGDKPALLLDDLASEFDQNHFQSALESAISTGAQLWLTGTQPPALDAAHKLFHVEQGLVHEVV